MKNKHAVSIESDEFWSALVWRCALEPWRGSDFELTPTEPVVIVPDAFAPADQRRGNWPFGAPLRGVVTAGQGWRATSESVGFEDLAGQRVERSEVIIVDLAVSVAAVALQMKAA